MPDPGVPRSTTARHAPFGRELERVGGRDGVRLGHLHALVRVRALVREALHHELHEHVRERELDPVPKAQHRELAVMPMPPLDPGPDGVVAAEVHDEPLAHRGVVRREPNELDLARGAWGFVGWEVRA